MSQTPLKPQKTRKNHFYKKKRRIGYEVSKQMAGSWFVNWQWGCLWCGWFCCFLGEIRCYVALL